MIHFSLFACNHLFIFIWQTIFMYLPIECVHLKYFSHLLKPFSTNDKILDSRKPLLFAMHEYLLFLSFLQSYISAVSFVSVVCSSVGRSLKFLYEFHSRYFSSLLLIQLLSNSFQIIKLYKITTMKQDSDTFQILCDFSLESSTRQNRHFDIAEF